MCQTSFANSSYKMIVKKYIIYVLTFLSCLFSIFATKQKYGGKQDNIKNTIYRLLNNTKPLRYQVYLDPCISDGNFSGYVQIDFLILEATKNISLHSQELQFCEEGVYLTPKGHLNETSIALQHTIHVENSTASIQSSDEIFDNSSQTITPSEFVYDKKEQTVTMTFDQIIMPARYLLEINYMGSINSISTGIYREFYNDLDDQKR
jgi:hypothetical protein